MYVVVYVDKIIIASNLNKACEKIINAMRKFFEVSVIDNTHFFLGIKIERNCRSSKLCIIQSAYPDKILKKFQLYKIHPQIQIESCSSLVKVSEGEMNNAQKIQYRELVGSLVFLECTSRPDIMHAATYFVRYITYCGRKHWEGAKKVAKYVSSPREYETWYGANDNGI